MPFGRSRHGGSGSLGAPPSPPSPAERLLRRTTIGVALTTMALIAGLLAVVGAVTAAAAFQATDQLVDRNLAASAGNMLQLLEPTPTPEPQATNEPEASAEPTNDNEGGEPGDGGAANNLPAARSTALPTAVPTVAATGVPTAEEDSPPGSSDTFFLVLDLAGRISANPQRVALLGLPDPVAADAALANGSDWRTINSGGVRVRLLTQPIKDAGGQPLGVLQSGFVLRFTDDLARQLTLTVGFISLIGLLGAALVTLLVTRRVLAPIRSAFAAERRFVAAASHELRTPVAVVRASAEIMQREELVRPEGRQMLDDIVSEADRLGRLVGDLLALASAEAGQISIRRQQIEMRGFVAELARRAETMATARGVRLEVVQAGAEPPADRQLLVSADADRMTQLLLIFVDNAIDHSPSGGVVRLIVQPLADGGRPRVSVDVVDQGPGVPAWEREHVFEPFARLTGQRRSGGGSGLGLAIARLLAARQDATLHIGDAPGGGAVFSVSLPRRLNGESPATA